MLVESLGKHVSYHVTTWTVDQLDLSSIDLFSDEVVTNIDMFSMTMKLRTLGHGDG